MARVPGLRDFQPVRRDSRSGSRYIHALAPARGHNHDERDVLLNVRAFVSWGLVMLLSCLAIAGCGTGSSESDTHEPGQAAFEANCSSCHGEDLRGTDQGPSLLDEDYGPGYHSDAAFRSAIENGSAQHIHNFGDMPAISGLTDAQIIGVISYIRQAQQGAGIETANRPSIPGLTDSG